MSIVKSSKHGPARDEAEDVAEPAHDEVLAAARDGIRRGELRVGEADADVDDAGEEERDVRSARRPAPRTSPRPTKMSAPTSE